MNYLNSFQKASFGTSFCGFARILFKRKIGNISFWNVRYVEDIVQLVLKKQVVINYQLISKLPVGSVVKFSGVKTKTQKNSHSIEVSAIEKYFVFKGTMPDKFHGLSNKVRYRDRCLDLISNNDSFNLFKKISTTTQVIRSFLYKHSYREFNSGVLHEVFEGGQATPFSTVCNANKKTLYLSLTSELRLKKLLIAGFEKVFEISQSFRNEGIDAVHSPEFSLLEFYAVQKNHKDMMVLIEEMVREVVRENNGTEDIECYDNSDVKTVVSYKDQFKRMSFRDAFEIYVGDHNDCTLPKMVEKFPKMFNGEMTTFTWLMKIIEKFFVPNIVNPTFLIDLPSGMSPFATVSPGGESTERAFFIAQRLFIADIYSDGNDSDKIRRILEQQYHKMGIPIKDEHLRFLSFGLVKTAGVGLGMNRLFMLFLNKLPKNIKETMLYPMI